MTVASIKRCAKCREDKDPDRDFARDWHLDHVIPLAAGGAHSYANVQVAHPICNIRKGGRAL